MKLTIKIAALLGLFASLGNAATTISGTTGTLFKGPDGTTNIPSGAVYMVIVDNTGDGFLSSASGGAIVPGLTGLSGKTLAVGNASITAGQTFGGDAILSVSSTSSAGVIGSLLTGVDVSAYSGKNFAVVWFNANSATLSGGLAGQSFGVISGADWVLPPDTGSTFTLSSTDAGVPASSTYYSFSATLSAAQLGSTGFFTGTGTAGDGTADVRSANFTIIGVPEPSAALLGALGALGLLRRRR